MAPAPSINTLYSGKYGANTITSSSGQHRPPRQQHSEAAAPTVIYRLLGPIFAPKRRLMESANRVRTPRSPWALVYPCSRTESVFCSRSTAVSFTQSGAGTLGLPMEKSKTFSAPIWAARSFPNSKSSRITERWVPRPTILWGSCACMKNHSFSSPPPFSGDGTLYTILKKTEKIKPRSHFPEKRSLLPLLLDGNFADKIFRRAFPVIISSHFFFILKRKIRRPFLRPVSAEGGGNAYLGKIGERNDTIEKTGKREGPRPST